MQFIRTCRSFPDKGRLQWSKLNAKANATSSNRNLKQLFRSDDTNIKEIFVYVFVFAFGEWALVRFNVVLVMSLYFASQHERATCGPFHSYMKTPMGRWVADIDKRLPDRKGFDSGEFFIKEAIDLIMTSLYAVLLHEKFTGLIILPAFVICIYVNPQYFDSITRFENEIQL